MNHSPTFQIVNPLQATIDDAENIIVQLRSASDVLEACIADEEQWRRNYREALETYEAAENEELAETVILAQQKEGPLAGIAVSGKGYDLVLNNLKNQLRKGALAHLWGSVDRIRRQHELSQVDLQQAETRFASLRKVADVKTQVLRASTI